jgi:hypothetical protein
MRPSLLWLLVALAVAGCEDDDGAATARAASPAARAQPTLSPAAVHDCRDECEQTQIIVGGSDAQLRACRARCDAQGAPAAPREVPRRITVAPAAREPRVYTQPR